MGFFHTTDPLVMLAIILTAGMALGALARQVSLPAVTGQILAGFLLGKSVLDVFDIDAVHRLQPLTHFALALIGVTVGAHLNIRRLRNAGKRLVYLLLAESTITPLVVCLGLVGLLDLPRNLAVLLATLAVSTAPATIVAIVRETRSTGVFVKTLIAAVAINNMACIFLFEVARGITRVVYLEELGHVPPAGGDLAHVLLASGARLVATVALGAGAAIAAEFLTRRVVLQDRLATMSAISILLTFGIAQHFGLSPLLACMALGAVQSNLNPSRDRLVDSVFANFEPAILCIFFTLAGLHLTFDKAGEAGAAAFVFFAARIAGKLASANLAMTMAGATESVRRGLGSALIPQAGVAIGLVILIQEDPVFAPVHEIFVAVVLVAVTLNEIVGPIMTRASLLQSGEVGRDRPRLVDFLQEENITTDFEAGSMEEAIEQLTDLLAATHHLPAAQRDALLQSARERESVVSTCLGGGIAVPHGEIPGSTPMLGVMAVSRRGLALDTPDGKPVHCMVLLATPQGERDRHLQVLAALARTVGSDPVVQHALFNAKSAAHVYEILHGEETEDFNYFLEDHAVVRTGDAG